MVRIMILLALMALNACTILPEAVSARMSEDEVLITEAKYGRGFDRYQAFINACLYTKYTCGDLELPNVVYKPMRKGLLGYYDGGDTIYVRAGLRGWQRKEVLMHESVHYVQKQIGGLTVPGAAFEICKAEEEAFTSVDEWLGDENRDYMKVGPNWWKPYTHCWQWYDPKWSKYSEYEKWIWSLEPSEG